jgi:hypothetical protein
MHEMLALFPAETISGNLPSGDTKNAVGNAPTSVLHGAVLTIGPLLPL